MRSVPELMLIVKGMGAAVKSVIWTLILLVMITYTWAILFTTTYHQGNALDEDVADDVEGFFGSMGKSIFSLLVMGTILDDVTACTDSIRSSENLWMLGAFLIFIVIASFMLTNMLLGILVEVVGSSAEGEKMSAKKAEFKEVALQLFDRLDKDKSGRISKEEFMEMGSSKKAAQALEALDVEKQHFELYAELLFQADEEEQDGSPKANGITYDELTNMILRLVPGASVSALDFAAMAKVISSSRKDLDRRIMKVEKRLVEICDATYGTNHQSKTNSSTPRCEQVESSANPSGLLMTPRSDVPPVRVTLPSEVPEEPSASDPKSDMPLVSTTNAPSNMPRMAPSKPSGKITVNTLAELDVTSTAHILEELRRRLGTKDISKTGVPMSMMDEELQARCREFAGGEQVSHSWC